MVPGIEKLIVRVADMDRDEALKLLRGGVEGIREWNQRRRADEAIPHLLGADLLGADLSVANLSGADLSNANLFGANLVNADLLGANLSNADLSNADLSNADLSNADLSGAKLLGADLLGADLSVANLSGADLGESQCGRTIFADVDLSEVRGLDPIKHLGPSTVGIDTLFRSHGKIPEAFLRGCGAPETLIAYLPSIMGAMQPIQFYSCFISYSSKDQSSPSVYTRTFKGRGSAASMLRRI
jgi:Pentapeptide repeats (8 copies)